MPAWDMDEASWEAGTKMDLEWENYTEIKYVHDCERERERDNRTCISNLLSETTGSMPCSPQRCYGLVVTCVHVLWCGYESPLTKPAKGSPCS